MFLKESPRSLRGTPYDSTSRGVKKGKGMGERAKIGLALGGGGARGLAHLGVLKVLEREVNMFQRAMKMFTGPRKIFRAGEGMF